MNAIEVARTLVERSPDALLVSSLGTATSALRSASDDGPHFYFGGAMGSAAATALGIADAVPEREVIALVGDGDLLMGASTLWSISALAPANLLLVALVDGHYSITGGQPISAETRFVEVARSLRHLAAARAHSTGRAGVAPPDPAAARVCSRPLWTSGPGRAASPFVDPHRVRRRFAARVNGGSDRTDLRRKERNHEDSRRRSRALGSRLRAPPPGGRARGHDPRSALARRRPRADRCGTRSPTASTRTSAR